MTEVTLADYVKRISPPEAEPTAVKTALEALNIAVDNYLRAMTRIATHGDERALANLRGTRFNLERAQVTANRSLAALREANAGADIPRRDLRN